jgi:hypothetical protein
VPRGGCSNRRRSLVDLRAGGAPAPVFLIGVSLKADFSPVVNVALAGDVVMSNAVVR